MTPKEFHCYPITSIPSPFLKSQRPKSPPKHPPPPPPPPSPPRRRSSRYSSTLRLVSTMTISSPRRSPGRHDACYERTSKDTKSNVRYLRDRISYQLGSASPSRKSSIETAANKRRMKVTKTVSTLPSNGKVKLTSTLSTLKDPTSSNKIKSRTDLSRNLSPEYHSKIRQQSKSPIGTRPRNLSEPSTIRSTSTSASKIRPISLERTFGMAKKKVDLTLPSKTEINYRLVKSPELVSPTEVQKVVQKGREKPKDIDIPVGTIIKKSTTLYSSTKNGKQSPRGREKTLNTTVYITPHGREVFKTASYETVSKPKTPSPTPTFGRSTPTRSTCRSPKNFLEDNKTLESLKKRRVSSSLTAKPVTKPLQKLTKIESKNDNKLNTDKGKTKYKKGKKNGDEAKKDKKNGKGKEVCKSKEKENKVAVKCAGRAAGTEIVKELKKMEHKPEIFCGYGTVTVDEINKQKSSMQSDAFFQKLLLRDIPSPTSSIMSSSIRSSNVLEKAKMFQTYETKSRSYDSSIKIPNIYLTHRRPVSDSKFRSLDLHNYESASVERLSGEHVLEKIRHFDSMSQLDDEDFGYTSSIRGRSPDLYYGRSSSEPPLKIVTTDSIHEPFRPTKEIRSPRTSASPSPIRSPARRKILSVKSQNQKLFDEHPIKIRARSAGDAEAVKREIRRSLMPPSTMSLSTSSLNLSNISDPSEYQAYVQELIHSNKKSDKFRELKNFYIALERLGQLELTTSNSDLRPRRKDEEIIDFDLWKKVRTYERAEQELQKLYGKLKHDQKEKGFLFRPSDVETIKWKREKERALKIRDRSVEDLKEHFTKLKEISSEFDENKKRDIEIHKDVYKPLWRGSSVANLAQHMVEKRSNSEGRGQMTRRKASYQRELDHFGIGSRIWSSLSMEQVNAIKNQLSEIYSQSSFRKTKPKPIKEDYIIEVPSIDKSKKDEVNSQLHIRSNSLSTADASIRSGKSLENAKSDSIGSISVATSSHVSPPLSETDKKRLSLTLSQEVLDRINKRQSAKAHSPVILGKETRGAIAAANANIHPTQKMIEAPSPRTCYSLEMSEDDSLSRQPTKRKEDFVLVLTHPNEDQVDKTVVKNVLNEWAQPKPSTPTPTSKRLSASETESASSETSTKTVIFKGKKEDLQKKVDFFENQKAQKSTETVIYKPAEDFPTKVETKPSTKEEKEASNKTGSLRKSSLKLAPSQSYADLKELFGEQEKLKYSTVPIAANVRNHCLSPIPTRLRTQSNSPVRYTSDFSSLESIYRTRSLSPDPEKYWRAYLALVKNGDVRRLKKKFESLEDMKEQDYLKRFKRRYGSDPELTRAYLSRKGTDLDKIIVRAQEFGDVDWLRRRYEVRTAGRGRSRTRRGRMTSPIQKVPIRADDRYMPHINVISKLASLKCKRSKKPISTVLSTNEERAAALGCPTGEVEKLTYKFESPERNMSLLGHMFTSSPNIQELRDIAPYLAGPWIAHQYPKRQDNSRSLSSPEYVPYSNGTYPPRRGRPRPKSASPPRSKKPLSILKTPIKTNDIFANQNFDPSIHRPVSRYQPPSSESSSYRPWWTPVPTYSRPTVTFKEPEMAPIPPPKGHHLIRDVGPESPRRYVENEVTIHYRSPVRQEVKEIIAEEELARRQAEAMRRIYQEERRRKYLQELQDMNSRRHTDNFIPSQKSPIPLNRYDDFDEITPKQSKSRDRTPESRLVARALFNFVGQSSRELTFRKGDIIYVRRQVDKNWYEGEHNAMIGLFPFNYVEIVPFDGVKTTAKKPHEGQARAKFNFVAQTHLELSLAKGELVILTRRVDENWFEGRIGNKKGIFPVSYVEILAYPGEQTDLSKPVASPAAHSLLLNGSSGGKQSMGSHHYQPAYSPGQQMSVSYHHAKPVNVTPVTGNQYGSLTRQQQSKTVNVNQTLHIDTHSEPIPYRAMYKYRPQNEDELELLEGDTVYVLEKCDDGWYVGSSQRTGAFGTFPGNYVERI